MRYRAEVDGLRALAVIPVVLFHAGIVGFTGGFVGVDVFFVISGYLITAKIYSDLQSGRFSFLDFYERRTRRILPLLLCVICVCIPAAFFLFAPSDFSRFANSITHALKLTSEIFFRKAGGYFDVVDYPRPLLHTWSLSIEEKYYIAFPIAFALIFTKWRKALIPSLSIATCVLFCVSAFLAIAKPDGSYYMFWARIWEILLGANVAVYGSRLSENIPERLKPVMTWAAIFALACCVYGYNSQTPYPGFYSAIPSISAALLIVALSPQSALGKIMASRAAVFIGLLSYSIYMWHLPAIVIAEEIEWFGTASQKALVITSVFAISYLSWRFIETPFRSKSSVSTKTFLVSSVVLLAVVLAASSYLKSFEDSRIASVTPKDTNGLQLVDECFLVETSDFAPKCHFTGQKLKPRVLLIGDSHASAIYPELSAWASSNNVDLKSMTAAYCLPLVLEFPQNRSETATKRCGSINRTVMDEIEANQPDLIVLAAYMYQWSAVAGTSSVDARWSYPSYFQDFKAALSQLAKSNTVIVFGQVPVWTKPLPDLVAQELGVFDRNVADIPQYSARGARPNLAQFDRDYRKAVEGSGATYLSVMDRVCTPEGCPRFEHNTQGIAELTTFDYGHLSEIGARSFISKTLLPSLAKLTN
ncbi:hypothetical protein RU07_12405 [Agrobacterium tumefaciens]|uniref:Acyltransferase n=1 Tax=Agrobacterium tumefaciens TaxID=358 RepID=A0A0D0J8L5_AGRTU|nr:hypothetical protein RU07_12405 [Agrobacterium tumefaciens]